MSTTTHIYTNGYYPTNSSTTVSSYTEETLINEHYGINTSSTNTYNLNVFPSIIINERYIDPYKNPFYLGMDFSNKSTGGYTTTLCFTSSSTDSDITLLNTGDQGTICSQPVSINLDADENWLKLLYPNYKKETFKSNLLIKVKSRADLIRDVPDNERNAIEMLREEITETEFRKYIKYGFILVKGKSGKIYQIFRNKLHTKVWKGGKLVEEICIQIKDSKIPLTDKIVAFKKMIQFDEEDFRKSGNIYNMQYAA